MIIFCEIFLGSDVAAKFLPLSCACHAFSTHIDILRDQCCDTYVIIIITSPLMYDLHILYSSTIMNLL